MEFRILGPLEVELSGQIVDLGTSRQRQLLALLLVRAGDAVSVDRLADELWSGEPPETARHTVQAYVHRLRKAFGPERGRLEGRASGYRLKVSMQELDVLRFERLAGEGRSALSAGHPQQATELLNGALNLWRGPVLSDLPDLMAFEAERARLEGMRLGVVEERVESDLALGRHSELVPELEALVSEHPFRERLWGQLMVALYRSGRQADALAAFRRARQVLGEELGIDPGPWLVDLEGRILLQDSGLSPPRTGRPPAPRHNLPVSRTTFVGRRRELAEVKGLLQSRRLLTITGAPGSGKTRLALEAARAVAGDYPHGTFFVSLADLQDPQLIPSVIDAVLKVPAAGQTLIEAVEAFLRPRRLLLVLDNFEHVLPGAPILGRLLDAASGVVVLATSRAPLRISGEQEYPLGPLPMPESEEVAAEPAEVDALALFADRARAVDPEFRLTAENAPLVAEMVTRLDRLPLAIELAAPRLRMFPLRELYRRLGPVLPHLTEGSFDSPVRQRTLRGAIAWSHYLLDPIDQAAFRRLAVFRGGFTLEAAEEIAAEPPVQDLTATISRLVEASLVERPVEVGPARFAMLETIREYGLEQLQAAGELAGVASRHAQLYAGLVQRAEPQLTGPRHIEWLDRLAAEQLNLRAALVWAKRSDTDLGLTMAGRMWRFWQLRGGLTEGRRWLEDLLEMARAEPIVPRAKALIGLAHVCYWLADLDQAEALYRQARELLDRLDDRWLQAEALFGEAITLACHRDEAQRAIPLEKEFQSLVSQYQHPALVVMGHVLAGTILRFGSRNLEEALPHGMEALAMTRHGGDRWWEGEVLRALGQIYYEQQRYHQAEDTLRESLELAWEIGHLTGVAIDLNWLGLVAVTQGRAEQGVTLSAAASRVRETVGGAFTVQHYRADAQQPQDVARGLVGAEEIDIAWARGRAMSVEDAVSYALTPAATVPG